MDQTLDLKLKEFQKTLASLEMALKEQKSDLVRDSVIKRFEYTFEIGWKTAKIFLSQKFGVDIFSPKECFREMRKNKLISDEDTEVSLKMTDHRNEIIHTYNEDFSDEVCEKIKEDYFKLLGNIYRALTNGK